MEKSSKRQRLPVALKVFAQEPRQMKARIRQRNALSQVVGRTKDSAQPFHLRLLGATETGRQIKPAAALGGMLAIPEVCAVYSLVATVVPGSPK